MAKPYSQDLRERVIATIEAGETQSATAKMFKISRRTVVNYVQRWREKGHLATAKFGGHKQHQLARHETRVRSMIEAWPDQTLAELRARLAKAGIPTSVSSLDRFLRFIGLTYKKTLIATEQKRKDVAAARAAWQQGQKTLDPAKLVFIDETWTSTAMTQRYGRAPRATA